MVEALQVPAELEQMTALYRDHAPKRVLEIGCWDGGTLKIWLEEATPGATIVAVDLEHRNRRKYADWLRSSCTLHVLTGASQDPAVISEIRSYASYEWAFIDGDHDEKHVRTDVETCLPLMRKGGLLLLHDIEPPDGMGSYPPGVVFDELKQYHYTRSFVDDAPSSVSHGIGVVRC